MHVPSLAKVVRRVKIPIDWLACPSVLLGIIYKSTFLLALKRVVSIILVIHDVYIEIVIIIFIFF